MDYVNQILDAVFGPVVPPTRSADADNDSYKYTTRGDRIVAGNSNKSPFSNTKENDVMYRFFSVFRGVRLAKAYSTTEFVVYAVNVYTYSDNDKRYLVAKIPVRMMEIMKERLKKGDLASISMSDVQKMFFDGGRGMLVGLVTTTEDMGVVLSITLPPNCFDSLKRINLQVSCRSMQSTCYNGPFMLVTVLLDGADKNPNKYADNISLADALYTNNCIIAFV